MKATNNPVYVYVYMYMYVYVYVYMYVYVYVYMYMYMYMYLYVPPYTYIESWYRVTGAYLAPPAALSTYR